MAYLVAKPTTRAIVNLVYLQLTPRYTALFYRGFHKIYRQQESATKAGAWKVRFSNQLIRVPLVTKQFSESWDCALSMTGHDIDLKQSYENLIFQAKDRRYCFLDVGANFGTHSILFLMKKIDTLSFEPNNNCHDFFRQMALLSRVTPCIEAVALGDRRATVELVFPENSTWLGTTNPIVIEKFGASSAKCIKTVVEQRLLDDYIHRIRSDRVILKIDTEGGELAVLTGSREILACFRPLVIFESLRDDPLRRALFTYFNEYGYGIFKHPWTSGCVSTVSPMNGSQFENCQATNFFATSLRPNEQ
jgi:FkbM family methyltransferase